MNQAKSQNDQASWRSLPWFIRRKAVRQGERRFLDLTRFLLWNKGVNTGRLHQQFGYRKSQNCVRRECANEPAERSVRVRQDRRRHRKRVEQPGQQSGRYSFRHLVFFVAMRLSSRFTPKIPTRRQRTYCVLGTVKSGFVWTRCSVWRSSIWWRVSKFNLPNSILTKPFSLSLKQTLCAVILDEYWDLNGLVHQAFHSSDPDNSTNSLVIIHIKSSTSKRSRPNIAQTNYLFLTQIKNQTRPA